MARAWFEPSIHNTIGLKSVRHNNSATYANILFEANLEYVKDFEAI